MKIRTPAFARPLHWVTAVIILSGCTAVGVSQFNGKFGKPEIQPRLVAADTAAGQRYHNEVKPILEARCVSCHACYEAPCQLNLDSAEGIDRGLTQQPVYSSARLFAAKTTRLFIDEQLTAAWRRDGFSPVLNERRQDPRANLEAGLLYQSLLLKAQHPLPTTKTLSDKEFNFSIDRANSCPSVETFDTYAMQNPLAGMPYGLPGLTGPELQTIRDWVADGGFMASSPPLSEGLRDQVERWERFLNQDSAKAQLISRYIYEHLFLANLYFDEEPGSAVYFKLVRSTTGPGEQIAIVKTRRPNSDPGVDRVYYRLQRSESALVTKTHLPYVLNQARMDWTEAIFFTPEYEVATLPGYTPEYINPFVTFKDIPANARYRFMLEDAKFIIEGFIKGPVCRGQVAVDVINDHFWVFFIDPDAEAIPTIDGFVEQQSANLRLPGSDGSNARLLSYWTTYSKLNADYLNAKRSALNNIFDGNMALNEELVWDGDGDNPHAALTVFRNFDNAAVVKGLVGNTPKTAWIIDYPLLERIHYLLVVDFDVYGNVGHQLNTRLYMDFLRIEGEYNFLMLMPLDARLELRDFWYRDANERAKQHFESVAFYPAEAPSIQYSTATPKDELLEKLRARLGSALHQDFDFSRSSAPVQHLQALTKIQNIVGTASTQLPETMLLILEGDESPPTLYTILSNRAHKNITSLFREQKNRLPDEDTITVARGVVGDYPNALLRVNESELDELVRMLTNLANEEDYAALIDRFGIRRTSQDFWAHSDAMHDIYSRQQPRLAGWMDYSRLDNR